MAILKPAKRTLPLQAAEDELVGKLAGLQRVDQRRQLLSVYRRHWHTRQVFVEALAQARDRKRKATTRGEPNRTEVAREDEASRAAGKAVESAAVMHKISLEMTPVPMAFVDDIITRIYAVTAAIDVVAEQTSEAEALALIGARIDQVLTDGSGELKDAQAYDCDRSYLVDSLRSNINDPQRLVARVMHRLGYSNADIGRLLEVARGTAVDEKQVRRIVSGPLSAQSTARSRTKARTN